MNLETGIYQILRKHRLTLKKREEVIVDLLDFIKKRDEDMNYAHCCKSDMLILTPKDAELFFNEVMNPKEANEALKKAMLKFITR